MKWLKVSRGNHTSHYTLYSRDDWDETLAEGLEVREVTFSVPCDEGEPARRFAALFHRHVLASKGHIAYEGGYLVFGFDYFCGYTFDSIRERWVDYVEQVCEKVLLCHPMGAGQEHYDQPPLKSEIPNVGTVPLFADDLESIQLDLLVGIEVEINDELELDLP